ncbi:hypothetical protein [Microvirga splendida]|uniref:Uncharacterized protein n=1 Tax=Microvirga splendida TaxID=2795727 RepID=A0ABS0Y8D0_9HYPH|nr:hypothetical protein [Microvirga splendida]MBJ6128559.1 hypothetical protein [Microvirga splendida]
MKANIAAIYIANQIAVQKLIRQYLVPPFEPFVEDDVSIKAEQTWNRYGVPSHGAETWRYEITGTDWHMVARAVFYEGELLEPLAVHCVIEECKSSGIETPEQALNTWLKSLDL